MITPMIAQSLLILAASIYVLVKGADVFIDNASVLGRYLGMSAFAVGVLIVGMGTSLPELASSLAAVWAGAPEMVIANAVGSNITNILLIVGVLAFFGGRVVIHQNLLKTELPLFFIATAHFGFAVRDGVVDRLEAVLLLATFGAYFWYILVESKADHEPLAEVNKEEVTPTDFPWRAVGFGVIGLIALVAGASFTVDSAIAIATIFGMPAAVVSITAIAIGTSLPELAVTVKAIRSKQTELGVGNIFGSCAFNTLVVVGLPGLLVTLVAADIVMDLGLAIMLVASAILFISGLARQIMRWEGLMMLIFFVFFVTKLFTLI